MNIGIEAISEEKFNDKVKIKFKNVLDGLNEYKYKNLNSVDGDNFEQEEQKFVNFLEETYKLNVSDCNCEEFCYIDFYLKDLNEDDYKKLLDGIDVLDREKIDYIRSAIINNKIINTVYFRVNDISIIKVLTEMCTRELFFITFYFTNIPLTIWGNYNLSFPIFYEDEYAIEKYLEIANECGVSIN